MSRHTHPSAKHINVKAYTPIPTTKAKVMKQKRTNDSITKQKMVNFYTYPQNFNPLEHKQFQQTLTSNTVGLLWNRSQM